jgi:SAM-dependent methyltransferase
MTDQRQAAAVLSELRSLLVCPACHGGLDWGEEETSCLSCLRRYSIEDGIPVLTVAPAEIDHDEIDHLHGRGHGPEVVSDQKGRQAAWFDRAEAVEFEITRPHGTPSLYRLFIENKLDRALAPVRHELAAWTALAVCGGSGMDAEVIAAAGARVITSDISIGASRRARERAQRAGLAILPIVADVEQLPFVDQTVDLVFVHDGLHHLERPYAGLEEMARVARRAVSVSEPARAGLTRLAVRLGFARAREEAGNEVARLDGRDVTASLERNGLSLRRRERYLMFYRHRPGRTFSLLSRSPVRQVVVGAWRAANALLGRFGNKLVVVAQRE